MLAGFLLLLQGGVALQAQYIDLLWERIAHYPLEGDGTDVSGFGNDGTLVGCSPAADRQGAAASALQFDGLGDYVACGVSLPRVRNRLTVSCWVLAGEQTRESHLVSKYDFSADAGFILSLQDGKAAWGGRIGSGGYFKVGSPDRIDDGRWHHVAGIVDGPVWKLFVDGVEVGSLDTGYARSDLDCSAPLTLGRYQAGDLGDHRYFEGTLDDVILYRRALNACEIEALAGDALPPPR